jgi:hypothetical protein
MWKEKKDRGQILLLSNSNTSTSEAIFYALSATATTAHHLNEIFRVLDEPTTLLEDFV